MGVYVADAATAVAMVSEAVVVIDGCSPCCLLSASCMSRLVCLFVFFQLCFCFFCYVFFSICVNVYLFSEMHFSFIFPRAPIPLSSA